MSGGYLSLLIGFFAVVALFAALLMTLVAAPLIVGILGSLMHIGGAIALGLMLAVSFRSDIDINDQCLVSGAVLGAGMGFSIGSYVGRFLGSNWVIDNILGTLSVASVVGGMKLTNPLECVPAAL